MENFTPREIVSELDKYIVGQKDAKRSVAIALRNRWRRQQVPDHLRDEIAPKNIIMIGPTGVGKTEIARRLAKLAQSPFLKIEPNKGPLRERVRKTTPPLPTRPGKSFGACFTGVNWTSAPWNWMSRIVASPWWKYLPVRGWKKWISTSAKCWVRYFPN